MVFVSFVAFEKIKLEYKSLEFLRFYKAKLRKFENFNFELDFFQKVLMVQRPTIRHLKVLVVDNKV